MLTTVSPRVAVFTSAIALFALLLAGAVRQPASAQTTGPDIVVVMVDDLGAIDDRVLSRLPNIRALFLERGLRFDRAYSETPQCCPGRAAFLTGQHTRTHGVTRNDGTLFDPSRSLATILDNAGYHTAMIGKYFNNAVALADHTPPGWDHVVMNDSETKNPSRFWVNDALVSAGYPDRFILQQAVEALRSAPMGTPMFLWSSTRAPHRDGAKPWVTFTEDRYLKDSRCSGIAPWRPPDYEYAPKPDGFPLTRVCRGLLTVDEMVGKLRAAARDRGRPTVWAFMSDNGMSWGRDGEPLKNVPNADRLPLYFAGTGVTRGATNALVSNIDIAPTLADLVGAEMPFADGISFAPVLAGAATARDSLFEDHPEAAGGAWWSTREGKWRLIVYPDTSSELYDVVSDPWEENPVENATVKEKMEANYPYR